MKIRHIEIRNFRGIKTLSWRVNGDFNCLIGPGDTCKTTILTALDFALSPRAGLFLDDADFFNQDVSQPVVIQVTLTDWDETRPEIRKFFQESKFAQYKCGIAETGPIPEPQPEDAAAVSISLRADKSLEAKWSVVKGHDEQEDQDRKPIYAADRAALGLSRLDLFSDFHFTWGRNTILTRLSADNQGDLGPVLAALAREMRQADISAHESVAEIQTVADSIRTEAQKAGVRLAALSPKIDIQRQSMGTGAVSLHEADVPLRNKGSGSKKLIGAAIQMKLHGGKNIAVIDELEVGLEPHRIRGLIHRLRNSGQQVFATTHSPVVLRELTVTNDELYVCNRDQAGTVTVNSVAAVPDIQRRIRANAEAFLGSRIVVCEGPTEIGCLRAYDVFRLGAGEPPVWSMSTSYFNSGGAGNLTATCPQLIALGYKTAVLCDNDAPEHLSAEDIRGLAESGVHICQWEPGNSTERQLFADMPWPDVPELLAAISANHDTLELASMIDAIVKEPRVAEQNLGPDPGVWPDSPVLRQVIGDLAHERGWSKRIDYAEGAFRFALPRLPDDSVTRSRLDALWTWIQANDP